MYFTHLISYLHRPFEKVKVTKPEKITTAQQSDQGPMEVEPIVAAAIT